MKQIEICLNGLKETVAQQERLTDKLVKEVVEYGYVSPKTAIELERSRQALRDAAVLIAQIEEEPENEY